MASNMIRVRAVSQGWVGGPALNTFYFVAGTVLPAPEPNDAVATLGVERVRAAFTAAALVWPNEWSVQVSPQVDVIRDTDGALMASFSVTPPPLIVGTNTLGYGPLATGLLVQLRTSVFSDGKRIQGRHFLSPVCNSIDDSGAPSGAIKSEAAKFMFELGNAGVSQAPRSVVWRRPRKARLVPPRPQRDGQVAVISSYTMPNRYVVMRSRRD